NIRAVYWTDAQSTHVTRRSKHEGLFLGAVSTPRSLPARVHPRFLNLNQEVNNTYRAMQLPSSKQSIKFCAPPSLISSRISSADRHCGHALTARRILMPARCVLLLFF